MCIRDRANATATPDVADVLARVDLRSESALMSSVALIRADRDGR